MAKLENAHDIDLMILEDRTGPVRPNPQTQILDPRQREWPIAVHVMPPSIRAMLWGLSIAVLFLLLGNIAFAVVYFGS